MDNLKVSFNSGTVLLDFPITTVKDNSVKTKSKDNYFEEFNIKFNNNFIKNIDYDKINSTLDKYTINDHVPDISIAKKYLEIANN